MRYPLVC